MEYFYEYISLRVGDVMIAEDFSNKEFFLELCILYFLPAILALCRLFKISKNEKKALGIGGLFLSCYSICVNIGYVVYLVLKNIQPLWLYCIHPVIWIVGLGVNIIRC